MLLTILMLLFAIVLVFFIFPFVVLLCLSIVGSGAPFVPVPERAVPGIVEALELQDGAVVYDMGCGDGRVLLAAFRANPNIRAIGIEKALLPYLLAKLRFRFASLPLSKGESEGVKLVRADFFTEDLSEATHVVTYLFPTLMARVEEKLGHELKPGTRIVAIDFPLERRKPTRIVEQRIDGLKRGTTLYIYD